MSRIEWTAKMNVGVPEIDRQHQRLLELFNDFEEGQATSLSAKQVRHLFVELQSYARYHFRSEENLMLVARWTGREEHAALHAEFAAKVSDLERLLEQEGTMPAALEGSRFLRHWIVRHIVVADRLAYATMQREGRLPG
jgi:hemerythrin-like metal-binding protein